MGKAQSGRESFSRTPKKHGHREEETKGQVRFLMAELNMAARFNPGTWGVEADGLCEFYASLVCVVSFRRARVIT